MRVSIGDGVREGSSSGARGRFTVWSSGVWRDAASGTSTSLSGALGSGKALTRVNATRPEKRVTKEIRMGAFKFQFKWRREIRRM